MTIKLIGALLIFIGCGAIGFSMANQSKREEEMLRQSILILEYMSNELQYHLSALPELFRMAAQNTSGVLSAFLMTYSNELLQQNSSDASTCLKEILTSQKQLPRRVSRVFEQIAVSIGVFDLSGQLTGFESAKMICESELKLLENNRDERLRSYHTLGLCAGSALAIMLF